MCRFTGVYTHIGVVYGQRKPPNYQQNEMPPTSFSCKDKIVGGYYADPETSCQMFHVCVNVVGTGVSKSQWISFDLLSTLNAVVAYPKWTVLYQYIVYRFKIFGSCARITRLLTKKIRFATTGIISTARRPRCFTATISIFISLVSIKNQLKLGPLWNISTTFT